MSTKLVFLCVLACAFQVLDAAAIRTAEEMSSVLNSYSDAVKEFMDTRQKYKPVVDKFDDVLMELSSEISDERFVGYLSSILDMADDFAPVEKPEPVFNVNLIAECVREQRPNMQALEARTIERVTEVREEINKYALELIGPYKEVAESAHRLIVAEVVQFPNKIKECIESGDLPKALEVIKQTKENIQKSVVRITEAIRMAKKLFPEIRERARTLRREVYQEVKEGLTVIHQNVARCVVEGGPKSPASESSLMRDQQAGQRALDVDTLVAPETARVKGQ